MTKPQDMPATICDELVGPAMVRVPREQAVLPRPGRQVRRRVEVSSRVPPRRSVKLWAFGYRDLAALFGMTEQAIRQAVNRKRLDPGDLQSVVRFHERARWRRGISGACGSTSTAPGQEAGLSPLHCLCGVSAVLGRR